MRTKYAASGSLTLIFTSTLFSLALAEIPLRTCQAERQVYDHKLFCDLDPLLGRRRIPNATGIHIRPENEYRIFVLRESYAEGYIVEFDELFAEVLKRNLNKHHMRRTEVINTGTGGCSTDQELLFCTSQGVKYKPDLTFLLFCSDDVLSNAQKRYWVGYNPVFQLQAGKLGLTKQAKLGSRRPAAVFSTRRDMFLRPITAVQEDSARACMTGSFPSLSPVP